MSDAAGPWTFNIPRPLSLNKQRSLHWGSCGKLKEQFKRDVRWSARQAGFDRLPLQCKIHCVIEIYGRFGVRTRDPGNWEKWIGDALGGFVIVDDSEAFWSYEVVLRQGPPAARLTITELDEPVPAGVAIRKPSTRGK